MGNYGVFITPTGMGWEEKIVEKYGIQTMKGVVDFVEQNAKPDDAVLVYRMIRKNGRIHIIPQSAF